eukprot:gene720-1390_t
MSFQAFMMDDKENFPSNNKNTLSEPAQPMESPFCSDRCLSKSREVVFKVSEEKTKQELSVRFAKTPLKDCGDDFHIHSVRSPYDQSEASSYTPIGPKSVSRTKFAGQTPRFVPQSSTDDSPQGPFQIGSDDRYSSPIFPSLISHNANDFEDCYGNMNDKVPHQVLPENGILQSLKWNISPSPTHFIPNQMNTGISHHMVDSLQQRDIQIIRDTPSPSNSNVSSLSSCQVNTYQPTTTLSPQIYNQNNISQNNHMSPNYTMTQSNGSITTSQWCDLEGLLGLSSAMPMSHSPSSTIYVDSTTTTISPQNTSTYTNAQMINSSPVNFIRNIHRSPSSPTIIKSSNQTQFSHTNITNPLTHGRIGSPRSVSVPARLAALNARLPRGEDRRIPPAEAPERMHHHQIQSQVTAGIAAAAPSNGYMSLTTTSDMTTTTRTSLSASTSISASMSMDEKGGCGGGCGGGGVSIRRPSLTRNMTKTDNNNNNNTTMSTVRWQDDCPAAFLSRREDVDSERSKTDLSNSVNKSIITMTNVTCPTTKDMGVGNSTSTKDMGVGNSTSTSTHEIKTISHIENIRTNTKELRSDGSSTTGTNTMDTTDTDTGTNKVDISIQCSSFIMNENNRHMNRNNHLNSPGRINPDIFDFDPTYSSSDDDGDGNGEVELGLDDLVGSPDSWPGKQRRASHANTNHTPYSGGKTRTMRSPAKSVRSGSNTPAAAATSAVVVMNSPFTLEKRRIRLDKGSNDRLPRSNDRLPRSNDRVPRSNDRSSRLGSASRLRVSEVNSEDGYDEDDGDVEEDYNLNMKHVEEAFQGEDEAEADDVSDTVTVATTLTLEPDDDSVTSETFRDRDFVARPPRLVAAGRRHKAEAQDDVKELTVQGQIGLSTTISLKFGNRKSKPQHLTTRAIQMRFDAYDGFKPDARGQTEDYQAESEITNAFQCTPNKLTVEPGEVAVLNISFTPDRLGVYSGALKIKSTRKASSSTSNSSVSFVILLRGEALPESSSSDMFVEESPAKNPTADVPYPTYTDKDPVYKNKSKGSSSSTKKLTVSPEVELNARTGQFHSDSDLDPLVLRQKWMRGWLARTGKKGSALNGVDISGKSKKANSTTSTITDHSVSVMPHTLVLSTPLTVSEDRERDARKGLTTQLEAALFIRNFSDEEISFTAVCSSATIRLRCKSAIVAAHDDASILVHYQRGGKEGDSDRRGSGSGSGSGGNAYLEEEEGMTATATATATTGHQGYILLTTSTGLEFVVEVRLSTVGSLTLPVPVEKAANASRLGRYDAIIQHGSVNGSEQTRRSLRLTEQQRLSWPGQNSETEPSESRQSRQGSQSQNTGTGVYFRKQSLEFGAVAIGSLSRMKVELCNATEDEVTIFIGDPALPFVILHNEIHLRPRSYVRVPVRFLPVTKNDFVTDLRAQTADGSFHFHVNLNGSSY